MDPTTGRPANGHRPYPPLGRPIGRLGLGSLRFTDATADGDVEVLDAFVDGGGTVVDTAAMYQGGASERVIGRWLRERGRRDEVVLLVKGGYPDAEGRRRINRAELRADLEASLERLGTDAVDLFMPHTDDPAVPVAELADILDELVREGRVRTLGASNWSIDRIAAYNVHAAAAGRAPLTASSVQWSLATRVVPYLPGNIGVDAAARAWYRRSRLPLFAWSSLALGFFFDPDAEPARESPASYDSPENRERRRRAWVIGRERGRTGAQVALAWLLAQPEQPVPLVGAGSVEHVQDMLAAASLVLSPAELDSLDLAPGPEPHPTT